MSSITATTPLARVAPKEALSARVRGPKPTRSVLAKNSRMIMRSRSRSLRCDAAAEDGSSSESASLPHAFAKAYDAVGDWLVAHPAPAWLVNSPLKTRITQLLAGPSYDPATSLATVQKLIASDDVVVFSATYCPFSAAAKAALTDAGVPFTAVEWNTTDGGAGFAPALAQLTGRSSIPSVWINGEYVGGCNDGCPGVRPLIKSGGLDTKLEGCSVRVRDSRAARVAENRRKSANVAVAKQTDRQPQLAYAFAMSDGGDGGDDESGDESMNSTNLPPEMLRKDIWEGEGMEKLGETVKNWGLFFVVFMAVGAGVVAANTYNDGAAFVDFQDYESPDEAVVAALKK